MSQRFRNLHLNRRAIAYGCLADIGASIAATILVGMIAAATSPDAASLQSTSQSGGIVAIRFILLLGATALGGYVAARISPRAELTNALGVGVVMTAMSVFGSVFVSNSQLSLLGALGLLLTLPSAMIGGLLRLSQLEQSAATS